MHNSRYGGAEFGDEVLASSGWHLHRSRLFVGVAADVVARYACIFTLGLARAGSIVRNASAGGDVHVIRRGKVRIEQYTCAGTAVIVSTLGSGDVFGLEHLVAERRYAPLAHAVHETLLLSAPSDRLRPALDESARFARNVAESFAQSLDGFALALDGFVHAPCSDRVLQALERIAQEHGVSVAGGILLDIALSPDDIATLTRCSREAVTTALFFLEREGRIRTDGSLVTLLKVR